MVMATRITVQVKLWQILGTHRYLGTHEEKNIAKSLKINSLL